MSRPLRISTGTPVVIDSSVAFKWFDATEYGADVAVELLREHERDATALIAHAERLALYDATFIALASWLDADLVTADRRQAQTDSCRVRLIG